MKQLYTKIAIAIAALAIMPGIISAQTGSRLIAHSYYMPSGSNIIAYDSEQYVYPTTATSLYSQKFYYLNGSSTWALSSKFDYTYNSAGNMTNMVVQSWTGSAYINQGLTFYMLNSAGYCIKDSNVLWLTASSTYRNNVRNTYTLNSAGQITDQVYEYWDAGSNALLPTFHYVNSYNAQGKPLVMLTQDWDASIHWMDWDRTTYAYDASGINLQTITGENSPSFGSPLQLVYQNVYTLNSNGTAASCLSNIWNSSSSSYRPSMSSTYTYDANGNNTLSKDDQWNTASSTYKPYQQYVRTFNSHNQMTSETRMLWNGTAYVPNSQDNYYYETYSPTAVSNVSVDVAKLSLAPIPTTGDLHIALHWNEAQSFNIMLTDMSGRVCRSFSAPSAADYIDNINISNLPAGAYVFTIRGELGSSISRTIILQH